VWNDPRALLDRVVMGVYRKRWNAAAVDEWQQLRSFLAKTDQF